MNRILIDTWLQDDCTLGRLSFGDFKCFTLELPWLDNQQNISCIPAGLYQAEKRWSPGMKAWVIWLTDVEGRTWIYIHNGNYTRQILGCILVGDGIKYLDEDDIPDVTNSEKTFERLMALVSDKFEVEIRR
jgi:hypothetical protein